MCPQAVLNYPQFWDGPLREDDIGFPKPAMDEFGCLNLNITVPRLALESGQDSRLPVFVYVHGGGFVGGSHSVQVCGREVYDGTDLVKYSLVQNKAIIYVSLNYRVGPLGFLASEQLERFNKAHNEPVGNYGLHDQRQALEWISRFIIGFGGDPNNVTIQGSSAGGASCHYLSHFPERKFQRAILASGTIVGIAPLEIKDHQPIFDNFLNILTSPLAPDVHTQGQRGIIYSGDHHIVQSLQSVPAVDFVNSVQLGVWQPLIDGEWILGSMADSIRHVKTLPDLMIGSCSYEVSGVKTTA